MAQRTKTPAAKARQLKPAKHRSLRLSRRVRHPVKLPNVWRLFRDSWRRLFVAPWLFLAVFVIYGVLTFVLVRGFGGGLNISALKDLFEHVFHGRSLSTSFTLFGFLLNSISGGPSPTAGLYQSILIIVFSLVFIWTLRQAQAGHRVGLRDSFYKSLYPLIPFLLVLAVIAIELIPLLIGNTLYNTVVTNGIAVGLFEKILWGSFFFMVALLSLYWLSSSLFALYIVTLPGMTPIKALRTARQLVRHRRWTVLRKVLFLPVVLLVLAGLLVIPIIILLPAAAQWVFFIYSLLALFWIHSYMYNLYRELLV